MSLENNDASHALVRQANRMLRELFPICRSITGDGVRQTLAALNETAKFETHEIRSGTEVFDWRVPDEWRVRAAYIETTDGRRIVDFHDNNLHLVSYSTPFSGELSFDELAPRLHTLPEQPSAIPYRTAYYRRDWGFCLKHSTLCAMNRAERYRVVVDTELFPGAMTLGEAVLPGASGREYIVHTYCCHPSMGNDNLSGIVLWALLLRYLAARPRRHGYRFVIAPETIGALAYLHMRKDALSGVAGGFVLTTVAGMAPFSLKLSFSENTPLDRAAKHVLAARDTGFIQRPFDVLGSDERQYSSPGFRIPMISICRSQYHHYPAYHTSLDDLEFISAESLVESFNAYAEVIDILEQDVTLHSLAPYGEPMLGKRGLYPDLGGSLQTAGNEQRTRHIRHLLWIMFLADGQHTLLDVAERAEAPFADILAIAKDLEGQALLRMEHAGSRSP